MTLQITPNGLEIDTFEEVFNKLVEDYKAIYGQDIDLNQNTADGQRVAIHAKGYSDIQTALQSLYSGWDVDKAEGVQLERMIALCGIQRRAATRSTWDVNITSTGAELYSGYTIKDAAGQEWTRDTALTIPAGITLVSFKAKNEGAVIGLSGSVLTQVTILPEVTALAPVGAAVVGINEESDFELRQRRARSLLNPSFSTVGGLTAKLADLPNVTDVYVYENKTSILDPVLNLADHSIWVVIEGGDTASIAETMAKQKTAGTGEKGSVVGTWIETLKTGRLYTHEMRFDRPVNQPLYIRMTAVYIGTGTVDQTLIKNQLLAKKYLIGDAVESQDLYAIAAISNVSLTGIEVSVDETTWVPRLAGIAGTKFVTSAANITIL
jgi:uncharacterized phage protein gp47/JayE